MLTLSFIMQYQYTIHVEDRNEVSFQNIEKSHHMTQEKIVNLPNKANTIGYQQQIPRRLIKAQLKKK